MVQQFHSAASGVIIITAAVFKVEQENVIKIRSWLQLRQKTRASASWSNRDKQSGFLSLWPTHSYSEVSWEPVTADRHCFHNKAHIILPKQARSGPHVSCGHTRYQGGGWAEKDLSLQKSLKEPGFLVRRLRLPPPGPPVATPLLYTRQPYAPNFHLQNYLHWYELISKCIQ